MKVSRGGLVSTSRVARSEILESRVLLADVTASLHATQDAYVRDGTYASQNFGQDPTLTVKTNTSGYTRQSFLTFDATGVGAAGSSVSKATLRLYGGTNSTASIAVSLYTVASSTWSENTINWSNKPARGTSSLGSRTVTYTKGWFEWDVTSYVAAERTAGHNAVSFALVAPQTSNPTIDFNSDEAATNQPQLVVTASDTVPPPPPPPDPTPTPDPTPDQGVRDRADAYVRGGSYGGQNFGQATTLDVKTADAERTRLSYLRFSLADAGVNSAAEIASASLRLFGRMQDTRIPSVTVSLYPVVDTTWSESTITANNKPAAGTTPIDAELVNGINGTWYEFDVSTYVRQQKLAGATDVAFMLQVTNSFDGMAQFNSDEAADNFPRLKVNKLQPNTNPGPIPATKPQVTVAAATYGVQISPGQIRLPDGTLVNVAGGIVPLDTPQVGPHQYSWTVPPDYRGEDPAVRWQDGAANLHPTLDTLSLGGPWHQVVPSSVVVKNAAGTVMTRDVDYKLNTEWGQVEGISGRLGVPGTDMCTINFTSMNERLDLIEVLPGGLLGLKKGVSAPVCPTLPTPDPGAIGLAGIFVFQLDGARTSGFTLTSQNIYPINPAAPVAMINPNTIPNTINKLKTGKSVNIAFFGDSITEGAEAGTWWNDRSKTYTDLVIGGLRKQFPAATINETLASQGGKGLTDSQSVFQSLVINPHLAGKTVDLLVINLGMNDKGKPSLDPVKQALSDYIDQARAVGIEVMVVTPINSNEYYFPSDRLPRGDIASAIKDVAIQKNAALVDMYTEWTNQATRGIAPLSQLHNTFNHPGVAGHRLIADTILRMFSAT